MWHTVTSCATVPRKTGSGCLNSCMDILIKTQMVGRHPDNLQHSVNWKPGHVATVKNEQEAQRMIEAGLATPLNAPEQKAAKPRRTKKETAKLGHIETPEG